MATNFEFYKDEILKMANNDLGFSLIDGKIRACCFAHCNRCDFHSSACRSTQIQWLYEEHIEQPKLTKRERAFCEAVRVGWIARDESGNLHLFDLVSKPYKQNGEWLNRSVSCNHIWVNSDEFDFIKWEDEKPWAVEDLLKLEVIEEGKE